jgi:Cytochrome b5-like Heme/Steroid binding domain/Eukaryotic cytochrome b561
LMNYAFVTSTSTFVEHGRRDWGNFYMKFYYIPPATPPPGVTPTPSPNGGNSSNGSDNKTDPGSTDGDLPANTLPSTDYPTPPQAVNDGA